MFLKSYMLQFSYDQYIIQTVSETLTIIHRKVDETKLSRKVLYHFAIFAVNKILTLL